MSKKYGTWHYQKQDLWNPWAEGYARSRLGAVVWSWNKGFESGCKEKYWKISWRFYVYIIQGRVFKVTNCDLKWGKRTSFEIYASGEFAEFKNRLLQIEQFCKDNAEAISDLSEDVQKDMDDIYVALSALAAMKKSIGTQDERPRIGFKK